MKHQEQMKSTTFSTGKVLRAAKTLLASEISSLDL
jgi:hypothetical protein